VSDVARRATWRGERRGDVPRRATRRAIPAQVHLGFANLDRAMNALRA